MVTLQGYSYSYIFTTSTYFTGDIYLIGPYFSALIWALEAIAPIIRAAQIRADHFRAAHFRAARIFRLKDISRHVNFL